MDKRKDIEREFSTFGLEMETLLGKGADPRAVAVMRTKLQEARMWAIEAFDFKPEVSK